MIMLRTSMKERRYSDPDDPVTNIREVECYSDPDDHVANISEIAMII